MGKVPRRMAFVGLRRRPVRPSSRREPIQQRPATKANWTITSVTGNLKLLRMTLPVLLDTAEVAYQRKQSSTNLTVCAEGSARWRESESHDDDDDLLLVDVDVPSE